MELSICNFCKKEFDVEIVKEVEAPIFDRVDYFGVDSLTEAEQALWLELLCLSCFHKGIF